MSWIVVSSRFSARDCWLLHCLGQRRGGRFLTLSTAPHPTPSLHIWSPLSEMGQLRGRLPEFILHASFPDVRNIWQLKIRGLIPTAGNQGRDFPSWFLSEHLPLKLVSVKFFLCLSKMDLFRNYISLLSVLWPRSVFLQALPVSVGREGPNFSACHAPSSKSTSYHKNSSLFSVFSPLGQVN